VIGRGIQSEENFDTASMEDSHKPHRAPHSGTKAAKKKAKNNGGAPKKGSNPKAFTMSGSRRAEKIARRAAEVLHVVFLCFSWTIDVREAAACPNGRSYA